MVDNVLQPEPETMAERHGRMLARLAALALAAAEDLAARAAQAEEPQLAADLHVALTKVGRCLRQTVMLEAKLARGDAARPAAAPAPARVTPNASAQRRDRLAELLESEVMEQLEGEERESRLNALVDLLNDEMDREGFLKERIEPQALRLCEKLGLTFGARGAKPPPSRAWDHADLHTYRWRGSG